MDLGDARVGAGDVPRPEAARRRRSRSADRRASNSSASSSSDRRWRPSPCARARPGRARACSDPRSRDSAAQPQTRRAASTCSASATAAATERDAGTVQTDVELDEDADLASGADCAASESSLDVDLASSTARSRRRCPRCARARPPCSGSDDLVRDRTSERPASTIALASHTVAVVSPIAPASICICPRIGLLWIFACGRSAEGNVDIRLAISSMLARTTGRSRTSAGVGTSSRLAPINWRGPARRSGGDISGFAPAPARRGSAAAVRR